MPTKLSADHHVSQAVVELGKARKAAMEADLDEVDVIEEIGDMMQDLLILNLRIRAVRATL